MKNLTKTTLVSLVTVTALSLGAWATCSEDVDMGDHNIINVADPVNPQDVATKKYVDNLLSNFGKKHFYVRDDDREIVTDIATKLMWQDNEDANTIEKQWQTFKKYELCLEAIERGEEELGRCEDTSGDTATTYCSALELGGYNNWRLPTRDELFGIVKSDVGTPTISGVFQNTASLYYWSATNDASKTGSAWRVFFHHGVTSSDIKSYHASIRCVRAGQ